MREYKYFIQGKNDRIEISKGAHIILIRKKSSKNEAKNYKTFKNSLNKKIPQIQRQYLPVIHSSTKSLKF